MSDKENFRVTADGHSVEIDVTMTVADWAIMQDWRRFQRDLHGVDGIRALRVDDVPPALVRQMTSWRIGSKLEGSKS